MTDVSYPLTSELTSDRMARRMRRFNAQLGAVRFHKPMKKGDLLRLLVKDNIGVADFPTSAGCYALRNLRLPDAFCIRQLRKNPAVDIFGKTHMTELAGFVTTKVLLDGYSELGGFGRNPYGHAFHCRGSSSGSAIAVCAGFCDAALGTETRGSLMLPAIANGVFGFKPTRGSVSRSGIIPLSSHLDAPGVLARNVSTLKTVFENMIGFDPSDPGSLDPAELRHRRQKLRKILIVLHEPKERSLLQGPLREFLQKLNANGIAIETVSAPTVSFDYKAISSLDIRRDLSEFLQRHPQPGIPIDFRSLLDAYDRREHSRPFGTGRLTDAWKMPEISEDALEKLVAENVERADAVISELLSRHDAQLIMMLSYADWWAIGGGPTLAMPVDFRSKPPVSIILGAKPKDDFFLLESARRLASSASDV